MDARTCDLTPELAMHSGNTALWIHVITSSGHPSLCSVPIFAPHLGHSLSGRIRGSFFFNSLRTSGSGLSLLASSTLADPQQILIREDTRTVSVAPDEGKGVTADSLVADGLHVITDRASGCGEIDPAEQSSFAFTSGAWASLPEVLVRI